MFPLTHDGVGNEVLGHAHGHVWLEDQPMAQFMDSYDASGTYQGTAVTYLHTDHLGTPRLGMDSTRQITWRNESDAFGNGGVSGTAVVRLRFPGQVVLGLGGVSYNYYRDYYPQWGRYVESDPMGPIISPNTYLYAAANPLRLTDPTGVDVTIAISRDAYSLNSVTGIFSATSDVVPDTVSGYTLETTTAGPRGTKDPIPPGSYDAFIRTDHDPNRIELLNVPGYENIQLHAGNFPHDVEGCFVVGSKRSTDYVGNSRKTMKNLLDLIKRDATGNIKVVVSGQSTGP